METATRIVGGRYQSLQRLGEGPSGTVRLASDTLSGQPVVLYQHIAADPGRVRRLLAETQRAARVRHRNVLPILDCGIEAGRLWIAAEHWPSKSLPTLLRRAPMRTALGLAIMRSVLAALDAAHAGGVVHGALEPGFVRALPDGDARVLGFGLHAGGEEEERPERFAERAAYRAPELIGGAPGAPASDQFSAARILLHCLTGAPDGDPSRLPAPVAAAVARALRPAPHERFESARALSLALDGGEEAWS